MSHLFPKYKNIDTSKIRLSPNSKYSVTPPHDATIIGKIIKKHISAHDITVVDATGNVGGDTINFALNPQIAHVTSIEINKETFENLKHNVKLYDLDKKVSLLNDDSSELLTKCELKGDLLYIDAPWGGSSYTKFKELNLKLGPLTLSRLVQKTFECKTFKYIMLKTPFNYKIKTLLQHTDTTNMTIYKIPTRSRYYLIIFIKV